MAVRKSQKAKNVHKATTIGYKVPKDPSFSLAMAMVLPFCSLARPGQLILALAFAIALLTQNSSSFQPLCSRRPHGTTGRLFSTLKEAPSAPNEIVPVEKTRSVKKAANSNDSSRPKIVLVAGFESFNRDLYYKASEGLDLELAVFADSDIRIPRPAADATERDKNPWRINPVFEEAVRSADAFVGSLIFDYDDAVAVQQLLPQVTGPCFIFESATELMKFNQVGKFSMMKADDAPSGPPPAVKAVLSKFGSGKEEDKLAGYLSLLKSGPDLLKYIPGEKAGDLRLWLEAYRFWNQGGKQNVRAMLQLIAGKCDATIEQQELPELMVTPDIGIVHPLRYNTFTGRDIAKTDAIAGESAMPDRFFGSSPATYLSWRLSKATKELAERENFHLAPDDAPKVAVLMYRKHVITEQKYIPDLIEMMEAQGVIPIPIFINGVEAHTIVRDLLTSEDEIEKVSQGQLQRDSTYQSAKAVSVDAIVNTVGFPLVGVSTVTRCRTQFFELVYLLTNKDLTHIFSRVLLVPWKLDEMWQWQSSYFLP